MAEKANRAQVQAAVKALLKNAVRLRLAWGLRPGTVHGTGVRPSAANVKVALDGDTDSSRCVSLIGHVTGGTRVMVLSVPPAGQYIIGSVGTDKARIGYRLYSIEYLTASATFRKADWPGLRAVRVRVVGGGGGGGGTAATGAGQVAESGGGGGGGYAEKWLEVGDLAASETVTVGAGGTGGAAGANAGSAGTATTFGTHAGGNGGSGGAGGTATAGTAVAAGGGGGGTSGTPDLALTGSTGGSGVVIGAVPVRGNRGGASYLSTEVGNSASSSAGNAGRNYGGGATGVRSGAAESARAGPDGGPGLVIIEVYV